MLNIIIKLHNFILKRNLCDSKEIIDKEIDKFVEFVDTLTDANSQIIKQRTISFFWNFIGKKEFPILKKVANIIFSIPTSQAASERIWSYYSYLHSKRRNRLNQEKVDKLVSLYANCEAFEEDFDIAKIILGYCDDADSLEIKE